jgi:hypothetical protein
VSTVLGRFVIPIYYVLGERLIDALARRGLDEGAEDDHQSGRWREGTLPVPGTLHHEGAGVREDVEEPVSV